MKRKIAVITAITVSSIVVLLSAQKVHGSSQGVLYPGGRSHGCDSTDRTYITHYDYGVSYNYHSTNHAEVTIPIEKQVASGVTSVTATVHVYDAGTDNFSCTLYSPNDYHTSYYSDSGTSSGTGNYSITLTIENVYSSYAIFCDVPDTYTGTSYKIQRISVVEYY